MSGPRSIPSQAPSTSTVCAWRCRPARHCTAQSPTPTETQQVAFRSLPVFGTPSSLGFPDVFDVNRPNLGQTLTWNGVDCNIEPNMYALQPNGVKPCRYCPGRDISLDIIKLIALHFTPETNQIPMVLTPEQVVAYQSNMDRYCRLLISATKAMARKWNTAPPSAGDIGEPQPITAKQLKITPFEEWGLVLPSWDEDEHQLELLKDIILADINSYAQMFNENPDEEVFWEEPAHGAAWLNTLWGTDYPAVVVDYQELSSDRSIEHLAFASAASLYTRRIEAKDQAYLPKAAGASPKGRGASPKGRGRSRKSTVNSAEPDGIDAAFVCDVNALADVPVREGFGQYGAIAYFNEERKLVAIYVADSKQTYYPGQAEWQKAKWFFKSSFFVTVTFIDHLVDCHLISANGFVTASRKLPHDHPLRRFTKAFTYRTIRINDAARGSLINRWGLVHRIWTLDYPELSTIATEKAEGFKLIPFPERVHPSMRGLPRHQFPLGTDAPAYYKIVRDFIGSMWALIFPTGLDPHGRAFVDELKTFFHVVEEDNYDPVDIVTQLVVNGTAYHELVGQVSDYLRAPNWIGAKLRPFAEDPMQDSITGYTMLQGLVLLTGLRMPNLLDDWRHLLPETDVSKRNIETEACNVYEKFMADLEVLAGQIDAGNKHPELLHPFMACHPSQLETSVSI